jgi:Xaa-Pro aminopeptidase
LFIPRYYKDGDFGIRIENLLEIQDCNPDRDEESTEKKFLKFSKLTLIPIQQNLINVDMLTEKELDWLDAYHKLVFEKVSPLLEPESLAMKWLQKSCTEIDRSKS